MEFDRLLLFGSIIFLTTSCRALRNLEEKPVIRIIQVMSHDDRSESQTDELKFDEISEEERAHICEEGKQLIDRDFQPSETTKTTELQEYIIENKPHEGRHRFEMIKAFECATLPKIFIQIPIFNARPDHLKLYAIFKDVSRAPNLEDIKGYQIQLAQDVTEVFVDEARSWSMKSLANTRSFMDTDELTERQRLQICQKATFLNHHVRLSHNFPPTADTKMKFYSLVSGEELDSGGRVVLQAFKCPTQPEVHIHIDENMEIWFIVQDENLRLPLDIMGYELEPVIDIAALPDKAVQKMLNLDVRRMVEAASAINFNQFTPDERFEFCAKTVRIMFGARVQVLKSVEIARCNFYSVQMMHRRHLRSMIVEAMDCPTDSPAIGHAYIQVRSQGRDNTVQVFFRESDDDTSSRWSAWADEDLDLMSE